MHVNSGSYGAIDDVSVIVESEEARTRWKDRLLCPLRPLQYLMGIPMLLLLQFTIVNALNYLDRGNIAVRLFPFVPFATLCLPSFFRAIGLSV